MVIYLDASVFLAHLLAEDRRPTEEFWAGPLTSSRLLVYETWVRLNDRGLVERSEDVLRALLEQMTFVDLRRAVLARALEPFPVRVRTLDALHLASADYLRKRELDVRIATYDRRMGAAAEAMEFELYPLNTAPA